jgi:beta-N-acetylhexosaminidase
VMVRMEGRATGELLAQARAGEIGGVVLFPPSDIAGDRLAGELKRLQGAARDGGNPRLLVAIDQEGGIVERLPALPPQLSPYTIAQNDDRQAASLEGRATGFQLREIGIDVNLAPVLDVPLSEDQFMAPRAFGSTPEQVERLGLAFAAGQRREGVAATAKHFPGLGRAIENTDFAPTAIQTSRAGLRADLAPFQAAIDDGIELVMLSSAAYPALGARGPAVLSPEVATDLLRGKMGFTGVSISDDLLAPAIAAEYPRRDAAVRASAAGVDVLLFAAEDAPGIAHGLAGAVQTGELDETALRASCERIVALKERLATGDPLSAG